MARPSEDDTVVMKFMKSVAEEIAYHHGIAFLGLTLKQKDASWLLVVRVNKRLDGRMVAFIECPSSWDCFVYLAEWCYCEKVPLKWYKDQFA